MTWGSALIELSVSRVSRCSLPSVSTRDSATYACPAAKQLDALMTAAGMDMPWDL
jgi:hypothetical protein